MRLITEVFLPGFVLLCVALPYVTYAETEMCARLLLTRMTSFYKLTREYQKYYTQSLISRKNVNILFIIVNV